MRRWLSSHQFAGDAGLPIREPRHWPPYTGHSPMPPMRFVYSVLAILALGIIVLAINVYHLQILHEENRSFRNNIPAVEAQGEDLPTEIRQQQQASREVATNKPIVWINGRNMETGYLNHVFKVFGRLGYEYGYAHSNWDILWAHDYPFVHLEKTMKNLKPHQKVNHFPGSGFFTNKVNLATLKSRHVPKAFRIPQDKQNLLEYAKLNPNKTFVQKNNKHRGIKVEKLSDLNFTQENSFVQEFIQDPFLINGRKFDIGIYTIITSIDPLRVYIYDGEALLRFCPMDYKPFDANILDKYVVGDDYTPIWEMPSLKNYYETLDYTMKESLNAYLRSQGKDPSTIWIQVHEAITEVLLEMEPKLILATRRFGSPRHFFEMVRFDFVLDTDLKLYIMEANMSPNLSSAHFTKNVLIYEQVIFNTLSLVGLASWLHTKDTEKSNAAINMRISEKDLAVYPDLCNSAECHKNCANERCALCRPCLNQDWIEILRDAYSEHMFRHNCRRIFPPTMPMNVNKTRTVNIKQAVNVKNKMLIWWFYGKCIQDQTWC